MTMKLSTLALAISAVIPAAYAATADDTTTKKNQTETMVVQGVTSGDFTPGGEQLVPAYLDGQIAHGGRIGMLGEQKAMDVPFNVIGYTSKLVQDQQAKTIADVVANDAGVQFVQGYGNSAETYRIRGLKFDGDDMTFGGLSGVVYALMGYVWLRGERDPQSGIFLQRGLIIFALIWIVAGWFDVFGMSMANGAHIAGLAVGLAMAFADTMNVRKRT